MVIRKVQDNIQRMHIELCPSLFQGLFYHQKNGVYVGIDNTTGECWTEEFNNLRSCIKWLRGW